MCFVTMLQILQQNCLNPMAIQPKSNKIKINSLLKIRWCVELDNLGHFLPKI